MSALAQLTKSTNILIYFCEAVLYSTKALFFLHLYSALIFHHTYRLFF